MPSSYVREEIERVDEEIPRHGLPEDTVLRFTLEVFDDGDNSHHDQAAEPDSDSDVTKLAVEIGRQCATHATKEGSEWLKSFLGVPTGNDLKWTQDPLFAQGVKDRFWFLASGLGPSPISIDHPYHSFPELMCNEAARSAASDGFDERLERVAGLVHSDGTSSQPPEESSESLGSKAGSDYAKAMIWGHTPSNTWGQQDDEACEQWRERMTERIHEEGIQVPMSEGFVDVSSFDRSVMMKCATTTFNNVTESYRNSLTSLASKDMHPT